MLFKEISIGLTTKKYILILRLSGQSAETRLHTVQALIHYAQGIALGTILRLDKMLVFGRNHSFLESGKFFFLSNLLDGYFFKFNIRVYFVREVHLVFVKFSIRASLAQGTRYYRRASRVARFACSAFPVLFPLGYFAVNDLSISVKRLVKISL